MPRRFLPLIHPVDPYSSAAMEGRMQRKTPNAVRTSLHTSHAIFSAATATGGAGAPILGDLKHTNVPAGRGTHMYANQVLLKRREVLDDSCY